MADNLNSAELGATAQKFNLNLGELQSILAKWGPAVLHLVIDALHEGFTLSFIKEALETLGPLLLTSTLQARRAMRTNSTLLMAPVGGHIIQADSVDNKDVDAPVLPPILPPILNGNILQNIIIQVLPNLLETYGPQVAQFFIDELVKWLKNQANQQQLVAAIMQATK